MTDGDQRSPLWRRWVVAGVVAATALPTALVTSPAGASGTPPQISVVTGSSGTKTVSLGHPQKAATAKLSPGYVAYNPANGDEVVSVRTSGGQAHVYLIAGSDEANEYHIATGITATTHTPIYGTLVKGDAYLVAGNGAAGMVAFPGGGTTPLLGQSPNVGAATNPVAPVSVAFDNSGNLLIAEALPTTGPSQTGIQVVAKAACSSSCPYKYSRLVAGGLYTIAGTGTWSGVTTTPAISFTYQVYGFGLAVDAQGNIIEGGSGIIVFLNEQTTTVTRYGKRLTAHKATVIAGTTLGTATCGGGAVSAPGTGGSSANFQWPHPFVDADGNVYVNDDKVSAGGGCTWVLAAGTGSLDGMTVTAGHLYTLTGAATTTTITNGAVANTTSFPNTVAAAMDAAGNVVVALSGLTPAVRVIAESTGTYYDQSMTKGHVYTISGGLGATRTTSPGNATGFKLPGATRPTTPPVFGLTSLVPGAPGDLFLTDGTSATTASLYEITKGPSHGPPKVTRVTPSKGPLAGGTKVTITGSNFTTVTSVNFGGKTVTSITTKTSTKLKVTDPTALSAGAVSISVTAAGLTGTMPSAFTYVAKPVVASVSPSKGPVAGATTVTITGSHFTTVTSVKFGGKPASIATRSPTKLKVTDPTGTPGAVSVSVTTTFGGTGTMPSAFTYVAKPVVTSVSPSKGPVPGATTVTITGSHFTTVTSVKFGGKTASIATRSPTKLKVTDPTGTPGAVSVSVTTTFGGTGTKPSAFTYVTPPTVTNFTPTVGSTNGGNTVTVAGTNFTAVSSVKFGTTTAFSYRVVTSTHIIAVSKSHAAGTVKISVTTNGGGTATSLHDFTFITPPTLSTVTPPAGKVSGGTVVTLTGTGFATGATSVTFGAGSHGTTVHVTGTTTLTVKAPSHSPGMVTVRITTPGGTSGTEPYTYDPVPTLTKVTPSAGKVSGGTVVTVTGTGFVSGAISVTFGAGNHGTTVHVTGTTTLTVKASSHSPGTVTVTVTTPGGTSGTEPYTYAVIPPPNIIAVTPTAGPITGHISVTITGSNFLGATAVHFDSKTATSFQVTSATTITAVIKAHPAGTVTVTVTTPGGTATWSGKFTYDDPPDRHRLHTDGWLDQRRDHDHNYRYLLHRDHLGEVRDNNSLQLPRGHIHTHPRRLQVSRGRHSQDLGHHERRRDGYFRP